ncbi:MAG: hypothetical protein DRK00_06430, partial [Thermoprotei archaeon]
SGGAYIDVTVVQALAWRAAAAVALLLAWLTAKPLIALLPESVAALLLAVVMLLALAWPKSFMVVTIFIAVAAILARALLPYIVREGGEAEEESC